MSFSERLGYKHGVRDERRVSSCDGPEDTSELVGEGDGGLVVAVLFAKT
jgi:hypothetical protein